MAIRKYDLITFSGAEYKCIKNNEKEEWTRNGVPIFGVYCSNEERRSLRKRLNNYIQKNGVIKKEEIGKKFLESLRFKDFFERGSRILYLKMTNENNFEILMSSKVSSVNPKIIIDKK